MLDAKSEFATLGDKRTDKVIWKINQTTQNDCEVCLICRYSTTGTSKSNFKQRTPAPHMPLYHFVPCFWYYHYVHFSPGLPWLHYFSSLYIFSEETHRVFCERQESGEGYSTNFQSSVCCVPSSAACTRKGQIHKEPWKRWAHRLVVTHVKKSSHQTLEIIWDMSLWWYCVK